MNKDFSQNILAVFSIVLAIHYLLAYKILNTIFSYFNVEYTPIEHFEDIIFMLGPINIIIISLMLLGIPIMMYFKLILSDATLENLGKESWASITENYKKTWIWFKAKNRKNKIIILLVLLIPTGALFAWLLSNTEYNPTNYPYIYTSYLLILLLGIFGYLFVHHKKEIVIGFYLFLMLIWSFRFIDEIFRDTFSSEELSSKTEISFVYENVKVKSSDSLELLFFGYNTILMRETRTDSISFFERNRVRSIKYHHLTKEEVKLLNQSSKEPLDM